MKTIVFILFILPIVCNAAIYKWTDQDGVMHFSDREEKNAHLVKLNKSSNSTNVSLNQRIRSKINKQNITNHYQNLTIITPQNEQTIHYNQGKVCIQIVISPKLQPNDKLTIFLDNKLIPKLQQNAAFCIYNVERGGHHLQAKITSHDGKLLIASTPITFFMRQPSIIKNKQ